MKNLIQNKIQCNNCKEIIQSYYRHDFKMCNCRQTGIDGGGVYSRRIGNNYTELSVYSNGTFEVERNLCWGVNYTKEGKKLHQTQWKFIKDLNTDHIWAILLNIPNIDKFYKEVFIDEIIFREEQILKTYEK